MAQLYGTNREESYAPSHGYTKNVYLVAKPLRSDETNQARIKPLVVNYHPPGGTAGPQRYVAEIQTVSREVIRRPVAVPVKEITKDYGSHVDGRSKRDDQFIARLQDAAIKANTGKLLGLNLDQPQVVPTNYQGKSTIDDRWSVQPNSFDEQDPRKVAELFNKVSNWRGTNGLDRGRLGDAYEGWSNTPSDRYKQPTQSSTPYSKGYYGGLGSQAKLDDSYAGRNNNLQAPRIGRNYTDQGGNYVGSGSQIERPFTPQAYDNHKKPGSINDNYGRLDDGYTGQTESLKGGGGLNKLPATQQSYGQPASYGGEAYGKPSSMRGDHSNIEGGSYGNHGSVETPRVGSGYTGQRENLNGGSGLNKPISTHQGYDQPTSYGGDTNMKPGGTGLNKPLSPQQSYAKPASYGGDAYGKPSSMRGDHSNIEDGSYGNHGSVEAPRVGSGYTGQRENLNGGSGLNKPISTHQSYDQPTSYGGDTNMKPGSMGDSQQSPRAGGGYTSQPDQLNGGTRWKKPIATQQVYDQPTSYEGDTNMKPGGMSDSQQSPRAGGGYTSQADQFNGGTGWKMPITTEQVYDQPKSYGGDTNMKPGGMSDRQQSPRAGGGYTSQADKFNGGTGWKKPITTQQVYDQPKSYGGDTNMKPGGMSDRQQSPRAGGGYTSQADKFNGGTGWKKPITTQQVYDQPKSYGGDTNMKPGGMSDRQQSPRAGGGYTSQPDQFSTRWKKPIATQQVYDQPTSYGGDNRVSPISKSSDYGSSEEKGYGNPVKSSDYQGRSNNPQAPQGYDYNRPRVEYDGGKQGYSYGYGDGVDTRRRDKPAYETYGSSYNPSARPNAVRSAGINVPEITSKQAVSKYNGAFV